MWGKHALVFAGEMFLIEIFGPRFEFLNQPNGRDVSNRLGFASNALAIRRMQTLRGYSMGIRSGSGTGGDECLLFLSGRIGKAGFLK